MDFNIKYSQITKEKLKEYYEENFLLKVSNLEFVFYGIYQLIRIMGWVLITAWLASIHNAFISKTLYNKFFYSFAIDLFAIDLFVFIFYFIIFPIIYFSLTKIPERHIFKETYRKEKERLILNEIRNYKVLLELEDLLETRTIIKIKSNGYSELTIEYKNKNGLLISEKINIEKYYKKIVKEEYIDFTWLDEKINAILLKAKYPEIKEEA